MAKITVDSADLKTALSLLKVYMGRQEPGGHFKDSGRRVVDAFYVVRVSRLERALNAHKAKLKTKKRPSGLEAGR